ncbi:ATP-binding protein [Flavobacterium sp. FlaQc-57]|uniref:sensor histidine kinase n=1 Tax=Flavobacterium sp. FlaQc-57 TaxID=3374186 RepID=UPI0037580D62
MGVHNSKIEDTIEELNILNKNLNDFVYRVSHDLRSPLNSIKALVSFIEQESTEKSTLEYLKMIKNSIYRLDESIKNNLKYSRNIFSELELCEISLEKSFKDAIDLFYSKIKIARINIQIDIDQQGVFFSDKLRLNSLLENLIDNAIKYQKKDEINKTIIIKGICDDQKFRFVITDNGIGISPVYHDKIFEMFFRLPGLVEGSGIGLYIVKQTVETLQGYIEVKSEEENGTSVIVELKNFKQ